VERAPAKTRKGEARRAAILAAAADLFCNQGFRTTSLDDIGAAAGVSGPAIYQYFESKHDLLASLIEEAATLWRKTVDEVLTKDDSPTVMLEHLIEAATDLQLRNGDLRAVVNHELRALPEDARRRIARIDRVTAAEWVHLLCEVRPDLTDEEARVAVIMVDGLIRSVSAQQTSVDRERLATVMKDMAIGALRAVGSSRQAVASA
jgi:AcrR family transcriptional regulator